MSFRQLSLPAISTSRATGSMNHPRWSTLRNASATACSKRLFHSGCLFGACSSGMEPGGLTQQLLCGQLVSVRCPGVGAAARNRILPQVPCRHPGMLGSQLKFAGGPLIQAGNLRAWITHRRAPGGEGRTGMGAYDAGGKLSRPARSVAAWSSARPRPMPSAPSRLPRFSATTWPHTWPAGPAALTGSCSPRPRVGRCGTTTSTSASSARRWLGLAAGAGPLPCSTAYLRGPAHRPGRPSQGDPGAPGP